MYNYLYEIKCNIDILSNFRSSSEILSIKRVNLKNVNTIWLQLNIFFKILKNILKIQI